MNETEEAAELLWRYLDELKRVGDTDAVNFIARTSLNPIEASSLLPLADEVYRVHAADSDLRGHGFASARARLLDEISGVKRASPWRTWRPVWQVRTAVCAALLAIVVCAAIGSVIRTYMNYYGNVKCPPKIPTKSLERPAVRSHPVVGIYKPTPQ